VAGSVAPPRPSLSLTVCSLAALYLCAVLCGGCVAAMLHSWASQGLGLGALLLLPGILGLGLTQYAGTFQCKAARAETVARLYSFAGGFMLIALICLLLDIARSGQHPSWPVMAIGGVFAGFAVWGRIGGRLNRQWAAELRLYEEGHESDPSLPVRKGHPSVWISTCLVLLAATGVVYWALAPRYGEHAEPDATPLVLPAGASDVCYWIYAGNTVFEFSISEQGFLAWAEAEIESRQGGLVEVMRITTPESVITYREWIPDAPPPHEFVIEEGYYHSCEQGGNKVQYAYDRQAGRAYYASYQQPAAGRRE